MSKFKEIIQSETPTLVDFFATWCGPCQQMSHELDKLKTKMGSTIRIVKIDVDKNKEVGTKFKVRSVPTLVLFKKWEILWRQAGGMDSRGLEQKIKKAI